LQNRLFCLCPLPAVFIVYGKQIIIKCVVNLNGSPIIIDL
jgi:hypothetical protein